MCEECWNHWSGSCYPRAAFCPLCRHQEFVSTLSQLHTRMAAPPGWLAAHNARPDPASVARRLGGPVPHPGAPNAAPPAVLQHPPISDDDAFLSEEAAFRRIFQEINFDTRLPVRPRFPRGPRAQVNANRPADSSSAAARDDSPPDCGASAATSLNTNPATNPARPELRADATSAAIPLSGFQATHDPARVHVPPRQPVADSWRLGHGPRFQQDPARVREPRVAAPTDPLPPRAIPPFQRPAEQFAQPVDGSSASGQVDPSRWRFENLGPAPTGRAGAAPTPGMEVFLDMLFRVNQSHGLPSVAAPTLRHQPDPTSAGLPPRVVGPPPGFEPLPDGHHLGVSSDAPSGHAAPPSRGVSRTVVPPQPGFEWPPMSTVEWPLMATVEAHGVQHDVPMIGVIPYVLSAPSPVERQQPTTRVPPRATGPPPGFEPLPTHIANSRGTQTETLSRLEARSAANTRPKPEQLPTKRGPQAPSQHKEYVTAAGDDMHDESTEHESVAPSASTTAPSDGAIDGYDADESDVGDQASMQDSERERSCCLSCICPIL